jgi:threonine/homoserine/homoserine lactone efflux protein
VLEYVLIFLYSIAFSFIISVPIGGVNMAVFQATLNHNRRAGYMIGFGAIMAEAIYCAVPMFGVTPFLEKLGIMDYLYFLFIPVLVIMGVVTIVKAQRERRAADLAQLQAAEPIEREEIDTNPSITNKTHRSLKGYFIYGFFLCASNPMTFVFWIQAVVFLRKEGIVNEHWDQILTWFLGVPVGTWLLYFGFVQLASITRRRMNQVWKARLNIIIGGIFIGLAAYMTIGYFLGKGEIVH